MQGCADFLRSFWGTFVADASIALVRSKYKIEAWVPIGDIAGLSDEDPGSDLYFTIVAHSSAAVTNNSRTKTTAAYLPGLFLDVDCYSPWRADDSFPTKSEVLDKFLPLFDEIPAPTIIVDSGGGLYPFWIFDKPKALETDADRIAADCLIKSFRKMVSDKLRFKNTVVDPAMNLATILRLPGSLNQKQDPPVQTSWEYWTDGSNKHSFDYLYKTTPLINIKPPPPVPTNKKLLTAVAKSAFEGALRRIKNAAHGMRNTVAYVEAAEVGPYYAVGELSDAHIEELIEMHIQSGEEPKKARNTITRGVQDGARGYEQRVIK